MYININYIIINKLYLNNKYFKKYREKIDDNGKEYHTLYDAKIVSL